MSCLFKGGIIFVKGKKFLFNRRIDQQTHGVTNVFLSLYFGSLLLLVSPVVLRHLHLLVFSRVKAAAAATRKTKDWVNLGSGYSYGSEFFKGLGENMSFDWHVQCNHYL